MAGINTTPPVIPSPVLKVHMRFTVDADTDVLPRFYLAYTGTPPTDAQLNAFAASIASAWTGAFQQWMFVQVVLTQVQVEDIGNTGASIGSASVSDPGTRAGQPNTAATCVVVNFQIARRYRGGKPKVFLPLGVNADLSSSGQWVPGLVAGVTAAWPNFLTGIRTGAWSGGTITTQVNLSLYQKFTPVENPITGRYRNVPLYRATALVDPVIGGTASPIVGSQRRRNRGGG